ncbi:MAG TPA: hypothetical protein VF110_15240 [Burkholderiales bacterium]
MGGYGTVGVLLLAGWTFLNASVAWAYLAAALAFEVWLARRMAALGRHPAAAGEAPYHFSEDEARLVGRYRYYFTETGKARQLSSVLAAIGLTALVLVPWLAYKLAFVPAGLIGLNVIAVAYLTRRLIPMVDTGAAWQKIRAGNE